MVHSTDMSESISNKQREQSEHADGTALMEQRSEQVRPREQLGLLGLRVLDVARTVQRDRRNHRIALVERLGHTLLAMPDVRRRLRGERIRQLMLKGVGRVFARWRLQPLRAPLLANIEWRSLLRRVLRLRHRHNYRRRHGILSLLLALILFPALFLPLMGLAHLATLVTVVQTTVPRGA